MAIKCSFKTLLQTFPVGPDDDQNNCFSSYKKVLKTQITRVYDI